MARDIKNRLKTLIEETKDENLLEAVYRILEEKNKIVIQQLHDKVIGKPLTIDQYNDELYKAIERIEKGEYVTHEQATQRLKKYE